MHFGQTWISHVFIAERFGLSLSTRICWMCAFWVVLHLVDWMHWHHWDMCPLKFSSTVGQYFLTLAALMVGHMTKLLYSFAISHVDFNRESSCIM